MMLPFKYPVVLGPLLSQFVFCFTAVLHDQLSSNPSCNAPTHFSWHVYHHNSHIRCNTSIQPQMRSEPLIPLQSIMQSTLSLRTVHYVQIHDEPTKQPKKPVFILIRCCTMSSNVVHLGCLVGGRMSLIRVRLLRSVVAIMAVQDTMTPVCFMQGDMLLLGGRYS